MKFNKKFLAKVAIFGAILGLNGMCFDNMVNCVESRNRKVNRRKKKVVPFAKCGKCGRILDLYRLELKTRESFCLNCVTFDSILTGYSYEYLLCPGFIKKYGLKKEDIESINEKLKEGRLKLRFGTLENLSPDFQAEVKAFPKQCTCSVCFSKKTAEFLRQGKFSTNKICQDCILKLKDAPVICPFCYCSDKKKVINNSKTKEGGTCYFCWKNEPIERLCCKEESICQDCIFKFGTLENLLPDFQAEVKAFPKQCTCSVCSSKKTAELLRQGKFSTNKICQDCILKLKDAPVICPFCYCSNEKKVINNSKTKEGGICYFCWKNEPIERLCCKEESICQNCIFKIINDGIFE